jgi:hypothetical protein
VNGVRIQFGLERKVVEGGVAFEQFAFDVTTQRRKKGLV